MSYIKGYIECLQSKPLFFPIASLEINFFFKCKRAEYYTSSFQPFDLPGAAVFRLRNCPGAMFGPLCTAVLSLRVHSGLWLVLRCWCTSHRTDLYQFPKVLSAKGIKMSVHQISMRAIAAQKTRRNIPL